MEFQTEKGKVWMQNWELQTNIQVFKRQCQVSTATAALEASYCSIGPHLEGDWLLGRKASAQSRELCSRTKLNIFISQLLQWQEIKYIYITSFLENASNFGSHKPNTKEKTQQFIISNPSNSPHPPNTYPTRYSFIPKLSSHQPQQLRFLWGRM